MSGMDSPGARLRRLLADKAPVLAPGAANALGARIAADCGFDAVYASGAAIANWSLTYGITEEHRATPAPHSSHTGWVNATNR